MRPGIPWVICTAMLLQSFSGRHFSQGNVIDLAGTQWIYIDSERTYSILFAPGARLTSTHPNDGTPDNDHWKQTGNQVKFSFNDGYAIYRGTIYDGDSIIGNAHNEADQTWAFKMYRYSDSLVPENVQ